MYLISVDGGTTNTRLVLIRDGEILGSLRLKVGMRDNVFGEGASYREALADGIRTLLADNGTEQKEVRGVLVSGMICSERGLYEIPHISAPVNVRTLAAAMQKMQFPGIADIPFYLIPGVRSFESSDAGLSSMDIMRGEETELFGIFDKLKCTGVFTLVLPGSHNKIIPVTEDGTLGVFYTSVSGELIRAAAENTILRDGIRDAYPKKLDEKYLLLGFDIARENGVTAALFKVRILQKYKDCTPDELFAVLAGAVLSEDLRILEKHGKGDILVGGSDPFRSAFVTLLSARTKLKANVLPDDVAAYAVAYGAERLMKERKD